MKRFFLMQFFNYETERKRRGLSRKGGISLKKSFILQLHMEMQINFSTSRVAEM